jgi:hypothetical protein
MLNSTAYQLSARFPGEWQGRYAQYFARHFAKRMTAEMVLDAVVKSSQVANPYLVEMYAGDVQQFDWASQLPDTIEPRAVNGVITGRPAQANTASRTFLNLFFRGTRSGQPRRVEGSIQQALALMNNPIVLNRARGGGSLVDTLINDSSKTNAQIVDELFLATVSRYPTAQEKTDALAALSADRAKGAENLYLVLVNKLDFIFY